MRKKIIILLMSLAACFLAAGFLVPATPAGPYNLVDTGQDQCFWDSGTIPCPGPGQAFYGQDSQHAGNRPSYTVGDDGLTVYDNVTGLTWTRTADLNGDGAIDSPDKLAFEQTQGYLADLNAEKSGGYGDWRIPSIKELYSLIGFRGIDPNVQDGGTGKLGPFIASGVFGFAHGDTAAGERVTDVHGAGCQRSDSKFGDAPQCPSWGHGPQGGLQLVFNHVRLVRDAG